jgi:hypothetical protein
MATVQKFLPQDNSSQANFDAWVEGIHDAIVNTMGWVQTADTGQAGTNPSVPSNAYVYRIYRMDDALQSTYPVFLKLEFGYSSTSVRIRAQLGVATDGAGNFVGYTTGLLTLPSYSNQGAAGVECNFSGSPGRLGIMMWRSGTSANGLFFGIERTLATDGTPNSDGVNIVASFYQNTAFQQTLVFGVGPGNTWTRPITLSMGAADAFNNNVPVSPVFPDYGKYGNPMTIVANMNGADVADGALIQTTLYGATRIYLASKTNGWSGNFGTLSTNVYALLMRYD